MRTSDILYSLLILICFFGLYIINISTIGINTIRDNWDKYKCNPGIIPFAWLFGKNVSSNMNECISNVQNDNLSVSLSPFKYIFGLFSHGFNSQNNTFASTFSILGEIQNLIKRAITFVLSFISNALFEGQKILLVIKDTLTKCIGIVITFIHSVNTMLTLTESALNSALVNTVFKLGDLVCFHPDTELQLDNNTTIKIKDITLNHILSNNNHITSIHKIVNTGPLYKINHTLVTGNHYIFYKNTYIHVKDHPDSQLTSIKPSYVYCIGTSTNQIKINDNIFHDWNDDYLNDKNITIEHQDFVNSLHENTYIKLHNHIYKTIKHVKIGDILLNNNKVIGISQFKYNNDSVISKNKKIICNGKQDILYNNEWIYAENHPDFTDDKQNNKSIFYSLITEHRLIHIDNYIFKDSL
jgi:hypothetical protein